MIIAQADYASEAFENNTVRVEVMHDGSATYATYNSKNEQTAVSYLPIAGKGSIAHV